MANETQAVVVFNAAEHADAIALGRALEEARLNATVYAEALMNTPNAAEQVRRIIDWCDASVFSACANDRQLDAHAICKRVRRALDTWQAATSEGEEAAAWAKLDVHAMLTLLVQRAPRTVKGMPDATLALRGYIHTLSGLRRVRLDAARFANPTAYAALESAKAARAKVVDAGTIASGLTPNVPALAAAQQG